jgi:hypothetical protein
MIDLNRFMENTQHPSITRTTFEIDIPNGIITKDATLIEDVNNIGIEKLILKQFRIESKEREIPQYYKYVANLKKQFGEGYTPHKKIRYIVENCKLIFIEDKRINYCRYEMTRKQYEFLKKYVDIEIESYRFNTIIPKGWKPSQEEIDVEIKDLLEQKSYYSDWKNQFHCPSGFIRTDYVEWKRDCKKYGLL